MILKNTLKLDSETLPEFAAELRRLTPEDRAELVELGAKMLGVEVDDDKAD